MPHCNIPYHTIKDAKKCFVLEETTIEHYKSIGFDTFEASCKDKIKIIEFWKKIQRLAFSASKFSSESSLRNRMDCSNCVMTLSLQLFLN